MRKLYGVQASEFFQGLDMVKELHVLAAHLHEENIHTA